MRTTSARGLEIIVSTQILKDASIEIVLISTRFKQGMLVAKMIFSNSTDTACGQNVANVQTYAKLIKLLCSRFGELNQLQMEFMTSPLLATDNEMENGGYYPRRTATRWRSNANSR